MKRIVIRLTCILFLFAFSLTINVNAISIAPFLDAIGVYGEGGIGEPVRREEFALVAANLCEDAPLVNSTVYSDVPQQSQYAEAIKIVTGQGIMNGVGDGKFGYGATIRSLDAVCVLVRILGYEDAAMQRAGYPNGYLFIADKIKLTKGIDITGNLTHEIMAELVYRAIDTGISNVTYLTDESIVYTADGDNTILRERMKLSRVQKGVVQANEYGAMEGLTVCGKDEMIIDGQIFKTKNFAQKQLLGYAVEFVYGLEDRNVAYIEPAGESVKFSGDKVVDFDTKSITYERGGKDIRLALKDVAYIYNSEIIYPTKEQLKTMFEGASSITAIKNDGGSSYNVVKFEIPTYYIVSAIDGNTIYTKEGFQVDISEVPALDGFDNPLMKSQVQANSVLGVFHGFNGGGIMYVKVINDWVKGTVEGISNEGVKIAGAWYKVADTVTLKVGDKGTFFLNEAMEIVSVDIEEASSFSYGYLRSIGGDTGFSTGLKANIYTVDDKFSNFNFADKCKVGGRNLDQDQMKAQVLPALIASSDGRAKYSQMVKYTLNSKGEINSFASMPKQMEFSSMHQGGIFYLGATIYAYADSTTRCFVLPG